MRTPGRDGRKERGSVPTPGRDGRKERGSVPTPGRDGRKERRSVPTFDELESSWRALPASPRDRGIVEMIIIRPALGERITLDRTELSVERGVVGDRWGDAATRLTDAQISLANARVADLVAGDVDRALFGDNFLVDLDLGQDALPAGTRLRMGAAWLEVTALPHTGCKKYSERFGSDALRWILHHEHRDRRLRGIYCRVIAGGSVAVGDAIEVVRVGSVPGAQSAR